MSELALKLIAENKVTKAKFLDLGNCAMSKIPDAIGELTWLEDLVLTGSWYDWDGESLVGHASSNKGAENTLTELGPLKPLTKLKHLVLSSLKFSDLTPLAGMTDMRRLHILNTKVSDLSPLASLTELEELLTWETQVSDLKPLAGATKLRRLWADRTKVGDLRPLSQMLALQELWLGHSQVSDIAPLAGLSALQTLDLSETAVADLSPVGALTSLTTILAGKTQVRDVSVLASLPGLRKVDISQTQLTDLSPLLEPIKRGIPVQWNSEWYKGDGIFVQDCPLTNPPPQIVQQGNEAILNYFAEREQGEVDHLYEAKMLILGEGGAGKTSLLRRLYQPGAPLPGENESTRGIAIYRHDFALKNGETFRLNVWDFGGQEIYHATHQFFLTHRSLYLLVDDTRKDYKSVSDDGFKRWLELIDVFGGHSPVLIFQNEKGGRSKQIDIGGIKQRFDNVKEMYAGNLEYPDSADPLREGIEFFAGNLSHIGEELPVRWIKVREDIEARAAEAPYISTQEYFDIYSRHLPFDRTKALLLSRYLHDLGVFLHFQDDLLLARRVILQNEWATKAVFRLLDDEIVKAHLGRFCAEDTDRLWPDEVYRDMHLELLALMEHFELCYELRDSVPQTWLAPQLLPPSRPAEFTDSAKAEDLVLRYRYDFLPKGMISRLTVRLHRFVQKPEMAWVTGVLFERDNTTVLVEVLPAGNEIELRARGPQSKELLSVIAADLDALNDSFQGLRDKVDKRIPCNCKVCSAAPVPEFFAQKALQRRKQDNRLKVECPRSYEDVDVLELLDGIKLENLPSWANEAPAAPAQPPVAAAGPRTIRIFLASSSEMEDDRDQFDLYFRQRNDWLVDKGIYLKIDRWENFLDAMSETRLQDEYNQAIRKCDIFVSLFFTKTGKFTDEEFQVAHKQFQDTGLPLIYTFFKDADVRPASVRKEDWKSLWAFQEKLTGLGHYQTNYDNIEHLKRQFRDQLDLILDKLSATTKAGARPASAK